MGKTRVLTLVSLLLFLAAQSFPAAAEDDNARYFPTTGHSVGGDFLTFFDTHGGLDVFGYPRTEQFVENGRTVQYFQRNRMELWPENPDPYKVQLMLIGSVVLGPGDPPIANDRIPSPDDAGIRYYPETGHTISQDFKDFFDSHGGLDVFGYPITEPKKQGDLLGQYFQRARFERWGSAPVTLGLLGDEYIFRQGRVPASLTAPVLQSVVAAAPDQASVSTGSGTKIVFQKSNGGPIYSIDPDGSGQKQIATGTDPSLSRDGQKLVYASWSYPEGIRVLNLATGEDTELFSVHEPRAPMWSPDGSKVAFYVKTQGYRRGRFGRGFEQDDFFNIVVLDVSQKKTSNPPDQPAHSFSPSWSPDGNRLVFKGDKGLYITSGDSTTQIDQTNTRFAFPVWSPDGKTIALMYHQHDHWEIGAINVDGTGLQLLTSSQPFTTPANNVAPAWSPDGSKLAFLSDRDGAWKLYTMSADGTGQSKLSDETIDYSWSMERAVYWGKK